MTISAYAVDFFLFFRARPGQRLPVYFLWLDFGSCFGRGRCCSPAVNNDNNDNNNNDDNNNNNNNIAIFSTEGNKDVVHFLEFSAVRRNLYEDTPCNKLYSN